ncbi:hypothetical protein M0R45_013813 [Rubus argutus]|uniref:Uncharacterized protein n=1 Tax=Rubus argutus TaxID=59490 RepID=A0AAW1XKF4_RUBAR
MDNFTVEQLQAMPLDKLKDLWEIEFRKHLRRLLATGPFNAVNVRNTLDSLGYVAIFFGKKYIARLPDLYSVVNCDPLLTIQPNPLLPIGQMKCYMSLLREGRREKKLNEFSPGGDYQTLDNIRLSAILIGQTMTRNLISMVVALNAENIRWRMEKYRKLETLFVFLRDTFKWKGKTNNYGVVYNRIIQLLRHARYEFRRVPAVKPVKLGHITVNGITTNLDDLNERDQFIDELLDKMVSFITKFEFLMSFPLLPELEDLFTATEGSLDWLAAILELMIGDNQLGEISRKANALVDKYEGFSYFEISKFEKKMSRISDELWWDLELLVHAN